MRVSQSAATLQWAAVALPLLTLAAGCHGFYLPGVTPAGFQKIIGRSYDQSVNFGRKQEVALDSAFDKCVVASYFVAMIASGLLKDASLREVVSSIGNMSFRMLQQVVAMLLLQVPPTDDEFRRPFLWNMVIRSYERRKEPQAAIILFLQMTRRGVSPDKFTFPFTLKACASASALREGQQLHCFISKTPLCLDLYVQGSLISMYASCRQIDAARASFDGMQHKNLISWNIMMDAYLKHGLLSAAYELFVQLPERDLYSWNLMIDGLAKRGWIGHARWLFEEMPERDIISWNSMIDGYARCGNMKAARDLFDQSPHKDEITWGAMLHGYAKSGKIEIAHNWFEKLPYKSVINWNCLINGYVRCSNIAEAHKLFELMPSRNLSSFNIILDAYVRQGEIEAAHQIFNRMPIKDVFSWNIMIYGNVRLGRIGMARKLFDTMLHRDVVSWNVIISGYKENGEPKEAVDLYNKMQLTREKPDLSTLAIVLSAIADIGLLPLGRWIHAYVDRNNIPLNNNVGVALIDMYSKCGYVDMAMKLFNSITHKYIDHWNAMMSGLAIHGHGHRALSLFQHMEQSHVKPDDITYIAILSACSHAGLVKEGQQHFKLMNSKYGINPKVQHYGCLIDLLSRAGHLKAAFELVRNMPMKPNDIIWRSLLGASRNHGNIDIAEYAAKRLIELVPSDSSSYVLLSNIYVHTGQHENAREIWKTMKNEGVLKTPGCSCIELEGVLHEFTVGHDTHPQIMEMYLVLNNLSQTLAVEGYLPHTAQSIFTSEL